jgi:CRP-like cAMP-binding protein
MLPRRVLRPLLLRWGLPPCSNAPVQWRLLAGLDEADRERVLAATVARSYSKRDTLFHAGDTGDTLHLLQSGKVAVRITTPDGDVATLAVLGPGEAFGELALLRASAARTATVIALEKVTTLTLHKDVFNRLCRDHPQIDRMLVTILAARVDRLSRHLTEALHLPADRRVLRRLVEVCRIYADEPGSGPVVVPLTQEDLAGLAGTTRPTVNTVLRRLEEQGSLTLGRGQIAVSDLAAVQHAAR